MAGGQVINKESASRAGGVFQFDEAQLKQVIYDVEKGHPLYEQDRPRITEIDEGLVLSFMAQGVKVAIDVTVEEDAKGKQRIIVVDGRRRVFNALEANRRLKKRNEPTLVVRAFVTKGDEQKLEEVMVSLNELRKDHSLMIKVAKAERMFARGQSLASIARAFGVEEQTVGQWLKLASLSAATKNLIASGKLNPSTAVKFADLSAADQATEIEAFFKTAEAEGVKPTARLAEALTKGKRAGKEASESTPGPSKKLLRAIITREDLAARVSPDLVKILKWVVGDIGNGSVQGVTSVISVLEKERREREEKKALAAKNRAEKQAQKASATTAA